MNFQDGIFRKCRSSNSKDVTYAPNEVARNKNLSNGAKGLYLTVLATPESKRDDFIKNTVLRLGESEARGNLWELLKNGYFRIVVKE